MADHALLHATSARVADDGSTYVVLRWEKVDDAAGYNLYRRPTDGPEGFGKPINGAKPITLPGTASELSTLVAPGSPEWLALAHGLSAVDERTLTRPVDPGAVFASGLSVRQAELVRATSRANLKMGEVAGLAYTDRGVIADQHYLYELRAVLANGEERVVAARVPAWAGRFVLPDPPSGLATQAGDGRVLVLWNRNPYAATYVVQRASTPGGPYIQVNPKPVAYDMDNGLEGEPLTMPRPGFLDIAAWNADGLPTSQVVAGVDVSGPYNGLTYWYRVASVDTLDRVGGWSAPAAATPVRTIPPMAPDALQVSANTSATGLAVKWRKVTRNVENHVLPDINQTNHLYRAASREALEDLSTLGDHLIATVDLNPQDDATPLGSWMDLDPALIPPFGSAPFFYRVRVIDPFGNVSAPSAVVSGAVPDTRPPGSTTLVAVRGGPNSIRVEWQPNHEPDLAGYQVYRGVCDRGYMYVPGIVRTKDKDGNVISRGESQYRCDMMLVGDVSVGEAKLRLAADGVVWFEDFSVPEGSPLCYGYWVRAYDFAGNLYAQPSHCPKEGEYRCARLREKTPPPVPVITGLRARNRGVLVEWISSPIQDLRAFHVYRSDKETGSPKFLACVFTDGTVSPTPWTGLMPSCADVPAIPDPLTARGSYHDDTAEPHQVYWYRVSALDWLGNESEAASLVNIPASSTFAYTSDLPPTPIVSPPSTPTTAGCGLVVAWTPAFDPARLTGFVVFRSTVGGSFRQVSGIIRDNAFTDASARRGVDYLYSVQSVDLVGLLSQPSLPVQFRH